MFRRLLPPRKFASLSTLSKSFACTALIMLCLGGCVLPLAKRSVEPPRQARFRVTLALDPAPISLSQHRRVEVTAAIHNLSKKLVHLAFPSTQRIELTLEDSKGRALFTWSEDQRIDSVPGNLAINPREKAVYRLEFPTRGLKAGVPHTIRVFMPAHPEIGSSLEFTPNP